MVRVDEMNLAVNLDGNAVLLAPSHAERAGKPHQLRHAALLDELRQPLDDAARALYMTVSLRLLKNNTLQYFSRKPLIVMNFTGRRGRGKLTPRIREKL